MLSTTQSAEQYAAFQASVSQAVPLKEQSVELRDTTFDADQQLHTFVKRTGSGFCVQEQSGGSFTFVRAQFEALPPVMALPKHRF